MYIVRNASAGTANVNATCERLVTGVGMMTCNLVLTKIEQYY